MEGISPSEIGFKKSPAGNSVKWHQYVTDFANIFKAFIGTNYLSLSFGFSQAGLGFGLLGLLVVSLLTNHCCKLIVKCKHILVDDLCHKYEALHPDEDNSVEVEALRKRLQRNLDYSDIGRLVLGKWGARLVNLFIVITQTGFCIAYVIFVGNMLQTFLPHAAPHRVMGNLSTARPVAQELGRAMEDAEMWRHLNRRDAQLPPTTPLPNTTHYAVNSPQPNNINRTNFSDLFINIFSSDLLNSQERFRNNSTAIGSNNTNQTNLNINSNDSKIRPDLLSNSTVEPSRLSNPSSVIQNSTIIGAATQPPLSVTGTTTTANGNRSSTKVPGTPSQYTGPSLIILTLIPLPVFILFTLFRVSQIKHTPPPKWCILAVVSRRSVRSLGLISVFANVTILVGFISVMAYLFINFQLSDSYSWFVFGTLPVYVAQVVSSFEAIGTIIPIEASMEENSGNFPACINVAVILFTCLTGLISTFGYLHYGQDTQQIIAQNLPVDNPVVIIINLTLIVGVLCTYPLQIFPVVQVFEGLVFTQGACCGPPKTYGADDDDDIADDTDTAKSSLLPSIEPELAMPIATYVPNSVSTWRRNVLRALVALFTCGVGILLRNVMAYVGALVGAIGSCPLAFILPCLFHYRLQRGTDVRTMAGKAKDVCVIVFGAVCGGIGCIVTMQQIIQRL